MIAELFQKVTRRKQERKAAIVKDIRTLVRLLAESELGVSELDVDADWYADVLEAEGWTEGELRANVDAYKQRVAQSKLAAQADTLRKAAATAEQAWRDADEAEGRRRQEAHTHLQQLELQMARAIEAAKRATAAKSDLIASAALSDEERELLDEQAKLNQRKAVILRALDPHAHIVDGRAFDAVYWGHVNETPAVLLRQTKAALADKKTGYSPERRKELESQLAAAERSVAAREKELAAVEKQAAAINEKLRKLADARLFPESFRLIRATPTRDELRKQHAQRIGVADGPAVAISVG